MMRSTLEREHFQWIDSSRGDMYGNSGVGDLKDVLQVVNVYLHALRSFGGPNVPDIGTDQFGNGGPGRQGRILTALVGRLKLSQFFLGNFEHMRFGTDTAVFFASTKLNVIEGRDCRGDGRDPTCSRLMLLVNLQLFHQCPPHSRTSLTHARILSGYIKSRNIIPHEPDHEHWFLPEFQNEPEWKRAGRPDFPSVRAAV